MTRSYKKRAVRHYLYLKSSVSLLFFLALAPLPCPFMAQIKITHVDFRGISAISVSKLEKAIQLKPGATFRNDLLERDIRIVLNLYAEKFYFLAGVDSIHQQILDSTHIALTWYIRENKSVKIGTIDTDQKKYSDLMDSQPGEDFDPIRWNADMEKILTRCANEGFPQAEILVADVFLKNQDGEPRLDIQFEVRENAAIEINRIRFHGNVNTKENVLLRELRIKTPTHYSASSVDEALSRLRRLTYIQSVASGQFTKNDSGYTLEIYLTEGSSNYFDGIAGYIPADPPLQGYFVGLLHLSMSNLSGTGRRTEVYWQKKNRLSQEVRLAYTEPWVLNYPFDATVRISQRIQDSLYTQLETGIETSLRVTPDWSVTAGFRYTTTEPSSALISITSNLPDITTPYFSLGVEGDSRDHRWNPRRGLYYNALWEYGNQSETRWEIAASGDTIVVQGIPNTYKRVTQKTISHRLRAGIESSTPITKKWNAFIGAHGAEFRSGQDVIPTSEHFRFGGLKTVRGYPEDFFSGTRVAWVNLEARYLTSESSRVFLFVDQGYYYSRSYDGINRVKKFDGTPRGYGFGIRYQTKAGLFSLDYGLGKHDTFSTSKIHFGIFTQF